MSLVQWLNQSVWTHYGFFLLTLGYMTADYLAKLAGPAGFTAYMLVVVMYMVLTGAYYFYRWLALYVLLGIAYISLSYANVLPAAWTQYYDTDWILRHGYFILAIYPLICASQHFWSFALKRGHMVGLMILTALSCLFLRSFIITIILPHKAEKFTFSAVYFYGLLNTEMMAMFAIAFLLIVTWPRKAPFTLPIFSLFIYLIGNTVQVQIMALMLPLLAFLPGPMRNLLIVGAITAFFTVSMVAMFYIAELSQMDANSTLRQLYWRDAWRAVAETYGLGIGFGREATANNFYGFLDFPPMEYASLMGNGIHNSYYNAFLRLGVLGGILFLLFVLGTCFPHGIRAPYIAAHASFAYFLAFLSMFVNTGMESPRAMLGITLCLGYVLACKALYSEPVVKTAVPLPIVRA